MQVISYLRESVCNFSGFLPSQRCIRVPRTSDRHGRTNLSLKDLRYDTNSIIYTQNNPKYAQVCSRRLLSWGDPYLHHSIIQNQENNQDQGPGLQLSHSLGRGQGVRGGGHRHGWVWPPRFLCNPGHKWKTGQEKCLALAGCHRSGLYLICRALQTYPIVFRLQIRGERWTNWLFVWRIPSLKKVRNFH